MTDIVTREIFLAPVDRDALALRLRLSHERR
jgi:hypothetical protein